MQFWTIRDKADDKKNGGKTAPQSAKIGLRLTEPS